MGAELLRTTDLEIWKITELLGLGSQQVLNNNFGKSFKMAPGAYRKKLAKAGDRRRVSLPPWAS